MTVQYSFLMQRVQMRGGTQYNILCYATCVDDVKLVQMKDGGQYTILCYAAWQMKGGRQYNMQLGR